MSKKIDLTNKRFGFWVALEPGPKNQHGKTQWLCECDCGTRRTLTTNSLRTGNSTSCGCNHTPDLIGKKFGALTVTSRDESKIKGRRYWICQCACGNSISVSTYNLRNNDVVSCGCCSIIPIEETVSTDGYPVEHLSKEDMPNPSSSYSSNNLYLIFKNLGMLHHNIKKFKSLIPKSFNL